jgi:hypothetical protein
MGLTLLTKNKYRERTKVLQYSLTFSGAAVAFIVTAKEKLGFSFPSSNLKWVLLAWGVTIFASFVQYILSYREVWYYESKEPTDKKRFLFWPEYILLYGSIFVQPIAMLISIILTVLLLLKGLPPIECKS